MEKAASLVDQFRIFTIRLSTSLRNREGLPSRTISVVNGSLDTIFPPDTPGTIAANTNPASNSPSQTCQHSTNNTKPSPP